MVHYYCYFQESGDFTPETKVFKVAVGDNRRDLTHLNLVENYAADLGYFFRPWDDATEEILILRSKRYVPDCGRVGFGCQVIRLTMTAFYRHLIDGDILTVNQSNIFVHNLHKLYSSISPKFFATHNSFLKYYFAPTYSRKYLSDGVESERNTAVVGLCLVALLFLFQAYLDHLEMMIL